MADRRISKEESARMRYILEKMDEYIFDHKEFDDVRGIKLVKE